MYERIRFHAISVVIAIAMWFGGLFIHYSYAPISWWFEYLEIETVQPVFAGEDIYFHSRIYGYREVDITWVDVIRCRSVTSGDRYSSEGRQVSSGRIQVQSPEDGARWKFSNPNLTAGQVCYLDSIMTVHLPFGINRQTRYIGDLFRVKRQSDIK